MDQLKNLFQREGFYTKLQHRFERFPQPGCIEDIYDGDIYKDLMKPGKKVMNTCHCEVHVRSNVCELQGNFNVIDSQN